MTTLIPVLGDQLSLSLSSLAGADPAADFYYERGQGLIISARALALLRSWCQNLTVTPAG